MSDEKIHFIHQKGVDASERLAKTLIHDLSQTRIADADTIVSIGGDGILLEAFHKAKGRKVYGATPADSNSRGFWTDHTVTNGADLLKRIERAHKFLITPLKGVIHFSSGATRGILAFNDIMIERESAQSALFTLTARFGDNVSGPHRVMAGGYIFSTAYGSTGGNHRYGGSVMPIDGNVIILTGKGISSPEGSHPVVVGMKDTSFYVEFISADKKRPIRIDHDGKSIGSSRKDGRITALDISSAPEDSVEFLTLYHPNIRSFSSAMPP